MSASTELLVEQITALEAQIAAEIAGSYRERTLSEQLAELHKRLAGASKALNEGKKVLND